MTYHVMSSIALSTWPVSHSVAAVAGNARNERMMALTSWSRSPETIAAVIAHTIAANMTASTAHRQNDHSPVAALHNDVDVSKRIVSATANIAAVVPAAIPRPAFSNMPQATSPRLQPNWMIPSLPPAA